MAASHPLPVLMPQIRGQRWSCHSCGNCCRTLVVHVSDEDRSRIDKRDWAGEIGAEPYVHVGGQWVLNKRDDGACVFLDDQTRCRIHSELGEEAKPLACRMFPFSVRPVPQGWQASIRFDCPSVSTSDGVPLAQHLPLLGDLVRHLAHGGGRDPTDVSLQRGVRATAEQIEAVTSHLVRWLCNEDLPMSRRLVGAARITATLEQARLKRLPENRVIELIDLLFGALGADSQRTPDHPTHRQRGMLRQLAFAHGEHVSLGDLKCGGVTRLLRRWHQLRAAGRFRKGKGLAPALPGLGGRVSFEAIEGVGSADRQVADIQGLLLRYLLARLESRSVLGAGYYGWPMFKGLTALWLSVAVSGWLARYVAGRAGRSHLTLDDVENALGIVDRAATRLPALGSMAERNRAVYLTADDGVARLVYQYGYTVDKT